MKIRVPAGANILHSAITLFAQVGFSCAGHPVLWRSVFGWRRLADLGTGPAPIARKGLTAVGLAQAMDRMVHDQMMRQRAADLGAKIRTEDGLGRAMEIIDQPVSKL